jgi:CBS domain-containing protein
MQTTTVEALMTSPAIDVAPSDSIAAARLAMERAWVRHLPVVQDGKVVGILSDRDLLRGADRVKTVAEAMTPQPLTVYVDTPAREAVALMLQHRIGALPVVGIDMGLIGVVTEADLLLEAHAALVASDIESPGDRFEIEHAVLRCNLEAVTGARHSHGASVALLELTQFLSRHFEREQASGGFFDRVAAAVCDTIATLDDLKNDHEDLLARSRKLAAHYAEAQPNMRVASDVHALVRDIEEHERRETKLWRDAVCSPRDDVSQ